MLPKTPSANHLATNNASLSLSPLATDDIIHWALKKHHDASFPHPRGAAKPITKRPRLLKSPAIALLCGLICVLLALSSCSSRPVIKLAVSPWLGAELNAWVAKLVMERELGLTAELVKVNETAQWERVSKGEIHASLEVWPTGRAREIDHYIKETRTVENLGLLGVVGKIGWYVTPDLARQFPLAVPWQILRDPMVIKALKADPADHDGVFLAGAPSWVQNDAAIIKNLGLNLRVRRLGSEEQLVAAVKRACREHTPLLFYFWSPHPLLAQCPVRQVKLPDFSPDCYARKGPQGIECDYPPEVLIKIAWKGLEPYSPKAHAFLRNFSYTSREQLNLMGLVSNRGLPPREAALAWIEKHPRVWKPWLPVD